MAGSAAASDQSLRGSVEVGRDRNGVEMILLRNPKGATVEVSCHGGQVLSWKTQRGEELLFIGSKAVYKPPPHAVRGGILICFPQFGTQETLEKCGFPMGGLWTIDRDPPPLPENGMTHVDLLLDPCAVDPKIWPHKFKFHLTVALADDGSLILVSRVRNVCSKPFSFKFVYLTYLAVSDIDDVRVEGLDSCDYHDNLKEGTRSTEQGISLSFDSEVDRVYVEAKGVIEVLDHKKRRTLKINRKGLPDVVVWNPWDKKSKAFANFWNLWAKKPKAIADFGEDDYKRMVSVSGAAIEKPITLKPGEEWTGRLTLTLCLSTKIEESTSKFGCSTSM
ncbi:hypothetical protein SLEP1_g40436 [Rubroshorea leprosula]|uniref:glucose-6-phosphate 1-epimerase n=1 Tax=Rubroshorea leprosula TaxID=152421 RepID=A0AAV5L3Z7_9ROSI|nr:hypothetical protein SLEP1_g40436 [Rubroshorea leprosula]